LFFRIAEEARDRRFKIFKESFNISTHHFFSKPEPEKTRFFVPTYFLQTKETEKIELPNKSKQIQATTSCIVKTTFESPNITYVKSLFFWK